MENQLLDNSTYLEAGELLKGINVKELDNEAIKRRYDNLLTLIHGLLIGDVLHYTGAKRTEEHMENEGVRYILQESVIKDIIKPFNYEGDIEEVKKKVKKEENDFLSVIREEIFKFESQYRNVIKNIVEGTKDVESINIHDLLKDEIKTYAIKQGMGHYLKNVGFDIMPYDSRADIEIDKIVSGGKGKEAQKLFDIVSNSFSKLKSNPDILADKIIWKLKNEIEGNNKSAENFKIYKWLPFVSHIVRTRFYIMLADDKDVVYNPLGTRGYFARNILKFIDVQADPTLNDAKLKLLSFTFLYVLKKCKFKRESFLKELMDLKNTHNIVDDVANILQQILLKRKGKGFDEEINDVENRLRKEIGNLRFDFNAKTTNFSFNNEAASKGGIIQLDDDISSFLHSPMFDGFVEFTKNSN